MRIPSLLVPLLLGSLACSRPKTEYFVAPGFPSAGYRTIAQDPDGERVLIREGMRPLPAATHLHAVMAELERLGYAPSPNPEADLWVSVYVLAKAAPQGGSADAGTRPEGGGGGRHGSHGGGGGNPGHGHSGRKPGEAAGAPLPGWGPFTLIVQLQDRRSGEAVWQGESVVDPAEVGPDGTLRGPEDAARQLLAPIPAPPAR